MIYDTMANFVRTSVAMVVAVCIVVTMLMAVVVVGVIMVVVVVAMIPTVTAMSTISTSEAKAPGLGCPLLVLMVQVTTMRRLVE